MEVPPNDTPEAVQSFYDIVIGLLSTYGWTILFLLVLLNLLWSHFEPKYRKWKEKLEDKTKEEEYRRNPEYVLAREEALAQSRQKLQDEYEKLCQEHEEKMKELERKKRQEKIDNYERLVNMKPPKNKSEKLRDGYNPLMGMGDASCSFRPSRQRGGGGGGG